MCNYGILSFGLHTWRWAYSLKSVARHADPHHCLTRSLAVEDTIARNLALTQNNDISQWDSTLHTAHKDNGKALLSFDMTTYMCLHNSNCSFNQGLLA